MKKILVLTLAIIFTLASFAQDKPEAATEKNVLKVNTLALLAGTGSVFYERQLTDYLSAELGIGFLSYKISDSKFSGLIVTPEFRLYPRKDAIDGFYLSPYLRYQNYNLSFENSKGTLSAFGGGVAFGRQWIGKSGFTMDLFFGGHYSSTNLKTTSGTDTFDSDPFKGFKTRMGFAIGFAF